MPSWAVVLIQQLWPVLWGFLGPLLTGAAEQIATKTGNTLPGPAKVALNYGSGITLATYMSNDTASLQVAALGGMLGAMIGNRLREAMKKNKVLPPDPTPPKP